MESRNFSKNVLPEEAGIHEVIKKLVSRFHGNDNDRNKPLTAGYP